MALDTGSWASWLFCNYYPHAHEMKDTFYTPTPEDFVPPKKYEELAEAMGGFITRYVPFKQCGPELKHMCFELSFHTWGRLAAALVEDGVIISSIGSSKSSKEKAASSKSQIWVLHITFLTTCICVSTLNP